MHAGPTGRTMRKRWPGSAVSDPDPEGSHGYPSYEISFNPT
jgi:hypothetical protein